MISCFIPFEDKNETSIPNIFHVLKSCPIYKISASSNLQVRLEILLIWQKFISQVCICIWQLCPWSVMDEMMVVLFNNFNCTTRIVQKFCHLPHIPGTSIEKILKLTTIQEARILPNDCYKMIYESCRKKWLYASNKVYHTTGIAGR